MAARARITIRTSIITQYVLHVFHEQTRESIQMRRYYLPTTVHMFRFDFQARVIENFLHNSFYRYRLITASLLFIVSVLVVYWRSIKISIINIVWFQLSSRLLRLTVCLFTYLWLVVFMRL